MGKLTVAKIVSKQLKIKLSHNHLSYDLVFSLFDRGSERATRLIEPMRYTPYVEAAKEGISFVTTHAYAHDFVSSTGQSDPEYLLKLEKGLVEAGAIPYFVHLTASDDVILERALSEDRNDYGKLTDESIVKEILKNRTGDITPPLKRVIKIDTSELSAQETAQKIINFVDL